MSLEELHQMEEDLLQGIWMLSLENDVYERYLTRCDPQSLRTIKSILERAKVTRRLTAHFIPRSSRMSFRESIASLHDFARHSIATTPSMTSIRSASRFKTPSLQTVGTMTETVKISMAHRITMAKKEVVEMRRKLEQFKLFAKRKKAHMRAEIEEIEVRINEAHEASEDFQEEVVVKGVDSITGKIPAERVIRFVEEWLRSANAILERLRLKSATARMQIRKARQQLIQRKELGETLHAIDFEKLNIENQDNAKMLEEKNLYVIDMKRIAGYYHLKLTQHKQKLNDLKLKLNEVKQDILSKQKQMEELENEHEVVEVKVKRMNSQLKNLLHFMENHTAPEILEFVEIQEQYIGLERTYKLLQRRRNIERIIFEEYQKQTQIRKKSGASEDKKKQ
ncbi:PREDICTED: coiled-coil domain-containing protein 113 [Eufriesea mexicana]|uniref:coiled-coil domain-containing protein 113 n=1 Tax=Eufriesea mexicana TaxID=516756 RepID=UPI00083C3662|nr:PREDICTED: coiled-coil domain-containing protein 113 [Eufriesea mexicana]